MRGWDALEMVFRLQQKHNRGPAAKSERPHRGTAEEREEPEVVMPAEQCQLERDP